MGEYLILNLTLFILHNNNFITNGDFSTYY